MFIRCYQVILVPNTRIHELIRGLVATILVWQSSHKERAARPAPLAKQRQVSPGKQHLLGCGKLKTYAYRDGYRNIPSWARGLAVLRRMQVGDIDVRALSELMERTTPLKARGPE